MTFTFGQLRILVGLVFLSVGIPSSARATLDRWAILADEQVAASGLTELLTAELGSVADLELVDRADIAAVLREQELSRLTHADEASRRIRVGQLLRADAMVLVTPNPDKDAAWLRVTIVDSRSGTRLWLGHAASPFGDIEHSVSDVAKALKRVRKRFADGIRCTVGVLPFVSDDLTHEFDQLQMGLCRLLQESLFGIPGVAVIEVEEARAIAQERQGRHKGVGRRMVPVVVEGQYSTARSTPGAPPTVSLQIRLTGESVEPTELLRESLPLPDVGPYLRETITAKILARLDVTSTGPTVSSEQQFEQLVARADRLAGLSAYPEAIGLREAALLIKPADASLRQATISEYLRALGNTRRSSGNDTQDCLECIRLWRIIRVHLEYLIRNRMLTQVQACGLIRGWVRSLYVVRVDKSHMLKECEVGKKQFLIDVFKRVQALERGAGSIPRWDNIYSFFLEHLLVRLDGNFHNDDDLQPLVDLVSQFDSKARFTSQEWAYALSGAGNFSETAHVAFCKVLQASSNAGIAAAGRYADLCRRQIRAAGTKQITPDMLKETQEIRKELSDAGALDFYLTAKTGTTVVQVKRDIARYHKAQPSPGTVKPPGPRSRTKPPTRAVTAVKPSKPQIELEKLLFKVRAGPGSPDQAAETRTCGVLDVLNCGEFDVLWSENSLYLHTTKGELTCLLAKSDALLEDVKWDGRYLWVGTRREGLWVFDRAGKLCTKVNREEGLPPVAENVWRVNDARSLLLHPVEEGKVLMVGQIMQNPRRSRSPVRSWCAVVTYAEGRSEVNVFLEARRTLAGGEDAESLHFNPEMGFRPKWISEHCVPEAGKRHVYVGRDFLDGMWKARKLPLRIDVETLEVDVVASGPPQRPVDLPEPFSEHRVLLAKLSDRPGKWGVSALLGVVAWPRYGGALQKVSLILPDAEVPSEEVTRAVTRGSLGSDRDNRK
jgi:hypothetical protein